MCEERKLTMRRDNRALTGSTSRRVGAVLCWVLLAVLLLVVAGCGGRQSAEDALSGEPSGNTEVSAAATAVDEPSGDTPDAEPPSGGTNAPAEKPAATSDTGTDAPAGDPEQDVASTTQTTPSKPSPEVGGTEAPGEGASTSGQQPATTPGKPAPSATGTSTQSPGTTGSSTQSPGTPAGTQAPSTPSSIGKPAPGTNAGTPAPSSPATGTATSPGKPSPASSSPVAETPPPVAAPGTGKPAPPSSTVSPNASDPAPDSTGALRDAAPEIPSDTTQATNTPSDPQPEESTGVPLSGDIFEQAERALDNLGSYRYQATVSFRGTLDGEFNEGEFEVEGEISEGGRSRVAWVDQLVNQRFEVIQIADQAWVLRDGTWQSAPGSEAEDMMGLIAFYAPAYTWEAMVDDFLEEDATYVGTATVNGVPTHHYSSDVSLSEDGETLDSEGDVWIAVDGGYPVKYEFDAEIRDASGGRATIRMSTEVNDANASIGIEAPR